MAKLTEMRYKDFVWPHNPRVYTIDYRREMAVHKVPFGRYGMQDLGLTRRVMRGEGEFAGKGAYEEFKRLASVFYREGAGTLVHPVWQSSSAYFVALTLRQEPRADYVSYSFEFWEDYDGGIQGLKRVQEPLSTPKTAGESGAVYHVVVKGQSLWSIAQKYGETVNALVKRNPQIKNPALIYPGEKVRVR